MMKHTKRDPLQRIDALMERAYTYFDRSTPGAVARGLGLLVWLSDERDRRIKAGQGGAR